MNGIPELMELQSLTYGNPNIKIAVLDGQVDLNHPCFATSNNKLVPWTKDQIIPSNSSGLSLNHGTAVTSLIFGKPRSSVQGVAPGCNGLIIPIYSNDANGKFISANQVDLAKAISIAVEQGAHIINISGGQLSDSGHPDSFLKQAIENCHKRGVLIVAATGNNGCSCLHVPASDSNVLAVGSMDESGNPTSNTNFGEAYKSNGILARGKNLTAAKAGGGTFQTDGGTSFATPVVSGVVGLLMSLQIMEGQQPNAYKIKSILEQTAIPCIGDGEIDCRRFLRGKLNLPSAIAAVRQNKGVLASGIEFTQPSKIINMKNHSNLASEEVLNSPIEVETAPSSEIMSEEAAKAQRPKPKIEINFDKILIDPSCACKDNPVPEDPESKDKEKSITNSSLNQNQEIGISASAENNSSNNIKNNNKMENISTNQNAGMPLTNENITPTKVLSPSGEIDPSCGCDDNEGAPAKVYALGTLGYDFGSESHRDSFTQSMGGGNVNPHDPAQMLPYLDQNPWAAEELIWTLNIDSTPMYAIIPGGPYSPVNYNNMRDFLAEQANGNIHRISVPGLTKGSKSLLNGHSVAMLQPRIRGMYAWTTKDLVKSTTTGKKGSAKANAEQEALRNFLNRVYDQMRNLGLTGEERALNYSATNIYQHKDIFAEAHNEGLELDTISAEKSPICKPGAECYDIKLTFFNPKERLTQARKQYRLTVDVSDVVPVTVTTGDIRYYYLY
ncbi:MAG: PatA/PatG family cyanobactin maturation protease [Saprospiraceae bacterium]